MNETIKIKNDNGKEKSFDLLFKYVSKNNEKTYITYTAYEKDEEGNIKCYSSEVDGEKLNPVVDEEELKTIDRLLKSMEESIKYKYCENGE